MGHQEAAILFLLFLVPHAGAQANPGGSEDPYQYARFSPSMAIIVVVLVAALFFMAFFSIYIRHCNDGTGSVRPVAALRDARASSAARGLDPDAIDKFPTFAYSAVKDLKIGKGALECAVCLSEFDHHETLRLIPKCDHVFHPHCIDAWLASHTTCPVCRADLAPPADVDQSPPVHPQADTQASITIEPAPPLLTPEVMIVDNSRVTRKFPRSHTTGHSLVRPGEDTERFTLRLPEEARRQIMANRKMNRATSMVVLPREGSTRRGPTGRWVFTAAPPFLSRTRLGDGETSGSPSIFARAFSIRLSRHAAREERQSTDSPV